MISGIVGNDEPDKGGSMGKAVNGSPFHGSEDNLEARIGKPQIKDLYTVDSGKSLAFRV